MECSSCFVSQCWAECLYLIVGGVWHYYSNINNCGFEQYSFVISLTVMGEEVTLIVLL